MANSKNEPAAHAAVFRVPRSSTVDLIAIELRMAIYSGALAVGSAIGEAEISSQLGVSRSPLREAAQRLVQEGLLTATPGRGLRVSTIGRQYLADLYDARFAIESQALRLILRNNDAAAIALLDRAFEHLVETSQGTDAREIGDADIAFHSTLVNSSGNRRLAHYMTTLVIETRIASFSMAEGYVVRRDVSSSYRRLLTALHTGDIAAAQSALQSQFNEAVARLRGELESRGIDVETVEEPAHEPPTLEPLEVDRIPE